MAQRDVVAVCRLLCLRLALQDYCYADNWGANGTQTTTNVSSADGFEGTGSDSYQPVWDAWMRFLQPLVSEVIHLPLAVHVHVRQGLVHVQITANSSMV